MNSILHIPTIMICTSIMTLVIAMALTFMWAYERREPAVGWWCVSMWTATLGAVLLAMRLIAPWWLAIALGNATVLLAYGLISAGFVAFAGRPVRLSFHVFGAAIALVLLLGSSTVAGDMNNRVMLISALIAFYCLHVALVAWRGWQRERLPSFLAATLFYVSHGLFYVFRIPMTLIWPLPHEYGPDVSLWYQLVILESFVHGLFSSVVFMSLVRERTERRYRLAAEIDSLTSASSRRFFVSETRALLARKPAAGVLALIDLDFFKKVNDTYGHMAGDCVLQNFGRYVDGQLAPGMLFGRLGGEEFGLYMPNANEADAADFLERLRSGVETLDIFFMGSRLAITASIGAASVAEAGCDFDHLMVGADNALYLAKDAGRNQVKMFSIGMRVHKIVESGEVSRVSLTKGRVSRVSVRSHTGRG